VAAVRKKHVNFAFKKDRYWTAHIALENHNPSKLWRSLATILRRDKDTSATSASDVHSADAFLRFFDDKVRSVRSSTDGRPPADVRVATGALLSGLQTCTEDDVRRIIIESPTKSCTLDPIPTFLLKESIEALLPFMTVMINASLREGCLPVTQKHALVSPLLKKTSLDPNEMKKYRPVSNLTFVSKVVERIVVKQLVDFLQSNSLMPRLQSAYRRHHSTETALLRSCPTSTRLLTVNV